MRGWIGEGEVNPPCICSQPAGPAMVIVLASEGASPGGPATPLIPDREAIETCGDLVAPGRRSHPRGRVRDDLADVLWLGVLLEYYWMMN